MYTFAVRRFGRTVALLAVLFIFICTGATFSQEINLAAANARDEFRWGVKAFHESQFNQAILAFEKALSYAPEDLQIRRWLGRAYFKSGFEETAIEIWDSVAAAGGGTALLQHQIDTIRGRRGINSELVVDPRYVVSHTQSGNSGEVALYFRPTSIFPLKDGSYYLSSFAGNQVVKFSANGAIKKKFLGGLQGIDHPFDVLETDDGYLFVTEFLAHQIYRTHTADGKSIRFGEKGVGEGQLIGPQFLADDGEGHLYVTEAGNRRVSKFDYDGTFLLSFGGHTSEFPGLRSPTGIFVHRDLVYVGDSQLKSVSVFDRSGNFLRTLAEGGLQAPEGISLYRPGILLIADTNRIVTLNLETEAIEVLSDLAGDAIRITKAVLDVNNALLAVDFTNNTVNVLTDITDLYTGLTTFVEKVDSDDFPGILLEVKVENRAGNPYIGLDESNFLVSEGGGGVAGLEYLNPVDAADPGVVVLFERSLDMENQREIAFAAVEELYEEFRDAGLLRAVAAGVNPQRVADKSNNKKDFTRHLVTEGLYEENWRLDMGLRLAGTELVRWPGPRAVVYITTGSPGENAFGEYNIETISQFYRNNGISLYCVYTTQNPDNPSELEYLSTSTGGRGLYVLQNRGLSPLARDISLQSTGRYFFSYESRSYSDFGNRFLPIEVEVFHYRLTGRDELGYFAPLE